LNAPSKYAYRNLPNIVSFLGVLPLCILLQGNTFLYLCPLIVFNNIMDDLDGILAKKLGLGSAFGAGLDNVCDAVAHILIAMVVGVHYGGFVLAASLISAVAILIRVVQRVDPSYVGGTGTPTNELMRHLLLVILLQEFLGPVAPSGGFGITPFLVVVFLLNSASMLVPFAMPHLVRSKAKTATTILGVNIALAVAWWIPVTAPFVAVIFLGTYLYSFVVGCVGWRQRA